MCQTRLGMEGLHRWGLAWGCSSKEERRSDIPLIGVQFFSSLPSQVRDFFIWWGSVICLIWRTLLRINFSISLETVTPFWGSMVKPKKIFWHLRKIGRQIRFRQWVHKLLLTIVLDWNRGVANRQSNGVTYRDTGVQISSPLPDCLNATI